MSNYKIIVSTKLHFLWNLINRFENKFLDFKNTQTKWLFQIMENQQTNTNNLTSAFHVKWMQNNAKQIRNTWTLINTLRQCFNHIIYQKVILKVSVSLRNKFTSMSNANWANTISRFSSPHSSTFPCGRNVCT